MEIILMLLGMLGSLSAGIRIRRRLESASTGNVTGLAMIALAVFLGASYGSTVSFIAFLLLFTGAGVIFGDPEIRIGITYTNGEPDLR